MIGYIFSAIALVAVVVLALQFFMYRGSDHGNK